MTTTHKKNKESSQILVDAHENFEKGLNLYAFFKLGDKALSKDVVQDTFLKTWTYLIKGGKIEMMKGFLYRILNNLIIDQYRKKKNISLDAMIEKGFEPVAEDSDSFANSLKALDGKSITMLIDQLSPSYRKVIYMKYVQDLSLKEISLLTGQSKNAVAVQAHRALKKLKLLYRS